MGLPITGLFSSSTEAIVAVEKLELFDVHPLDTLPDVSEKREYLRVGYVAVSVLREKAAAVLVHQTHRASRRGVDSISTICNGMQQESGSIRCRSELVAKLVRLHRALHEDVNASDHSYRNRSRGNFSVSLRQTHSLKITGTARRGDLSEIRDHCIGKLRCRGRLA